MSALTTLLHACRNSNRLIQSVLVAFVLSLGVAVAAPAMQAHTLGPDQQIICVGNGGMKVVTFAQDGSISDSQALPDSHCTWCGACTAVLPAGQAPQGLAARSDAQPILWGLPHVVVFVSITPPARAPPTAS